MDDSKSRGRNILVYGCTTLLFLLLICAVCVTLGYFVAPEEYVDYDQLAGYSDFTIAGANVGQTLGLITATPPQAAATAAALLTAAAPTFENIPTRTPTPTLMVLGSPTLPPTDTPRPRPTGTATFTPAPPTLTPDPAIDLAATEVAEAIIDIILSPEQLNGSITLVTVEDNHVFAPGVSQVEFSWLWSGGCDLLPDGYAFDLRIWPNRQDFGPLGVTEIESIAEETVCIPESGKRVYRLYYLSGVPAVQLQGAGSFLWDVAFVKKSPYTPLYAAPPRKFEISLNYPNPGPLDPEGAPGSVTCGNFGAWAEAQAFFIAAGGPNEDKFNLDPERNGIACDAIAPCLLINDVETCRNQF